MTDEIKRLRDRFADHNDLASARTLILALADAELARAKPDNGPVGVPPIAMTERDRLVFAAGVAAVFEYHGRTDTTCTAAQYAARSDAAIDAEKAVLSHDAAHAQRGENNAANERWTREHNRVSSRLQDAEVARDDAIRDRDRITSILAHQRTEHAERVKETTERAAAKVAEMERERDRLTAALATEVAACDAWRRVFTSDGHFVFGWSGATHQIGNNVSYSECAKHDARRAAESRSPAPPAAKTAEAERFAKGERVTYINGDVGVVAHNDYEEPFVPVRFDGSFATSYIERRNLRRAAPKGGA